MFAKQCFVLNGRCCAVFEEAFIPQEGSNFLWKRNILDLDLCSFTFLTGNLTIIICRYCHNLNDSYDNVHFLSLNMGIK